MSCLFQTGHLHPLPADHAEGTAHQYSVSHVLPMALNHLVVRAGPRNADSHAANLPALVVSRRPLHMVDEEKLHRARLGYDLEPQLLFQSGEQ